MRTCRYKWPRAPPYSIQPCLAKINLWFANRVRNFTRDRQLNGAISISSKTFFLHVRGTRCSSIGRDPRIRRLPKCRPGCLFISLIPRAVLRMQKSIGQQRQTKCQFRAFCYKPIGKLTLLRNVSVIRITVPGTFLLVAMVQGVDDAK